VYNQVIGIYLAAGKSTRFKRNKLIERIGKRPLGSIALVEALAFSLIHTVLVTSNKRDAFTLVEGVSNKEKARLSFITLSREKEEGMATSLREGIKNASQLYKNRPIMILLADQPFVTRKEINCLIEFYRHNPSFPFVAFQHARISPPLIIAPTLFDEVFQLRGDVGAREILNNNYQKEYFLQESNKHLFVDLDTQEDLRKWRYLFD